MADIIHWIFAVMSGIGLLGIFVTMLTPYSCAIPAQIRMTNRLSLSGGLLVLGILGMSLIHAL